MIDAIVFDLDGVLIDSETVWNEARCGLVAEQGGRWRPEAQRAMMGMSATEWSAYIHDELGVALSPAEISAAVVARLKERYRVNVPLISGARDAVLGLAARWPLALASSANREIIDLVLERAAMVACFAVTVSSEEVPHGKPAPDVYLEAARRLGTLPTRCAAVEDSTSGLRSAAAAEMTVIAVPNREFPPDADAVALAVAVVDTIKDVRPQLIDTLR